MEETLLEDDGRVWQAKLDKGSGRTFYKHLVSGKKQWRRPAEETIIPIKREEHQLRVWKAKIDPNANRAYYINKETKERTWHRPAEHLIIPSEAATFGLRPTQASGEEEESEESDDGEYEDTAALAAAAAVAQEAVARAAARAAAAAAAAAATPSLEETMRISDARVLSAGRNRYERAGAQSPDRERQRRTQVVRQYNTAARSGFASLGAEAHRTLLCEAAMAMVDLHGGARAFVSAFDPTGGRHVGAEDLYTGLRTTVNGTEMEVSEHDCARLSGSHGSDTLSMGQLLRVLAGDFDFDPEGKSPSPARASPLGGASPPPSGAPRSSPSWGASPPQTVLSAGEWREVGGGAGQRVQRGSSGRGHAAGGIDHVAPALHTAAGTNVNALLVYNERSKLNSLSLAEKALLLREAMADVVEVAGGVARFFRTFDADGDHLLSPSELRRGMVRNGLKLSKRDAAVVVSTFGGDGLNMGGLSRILSGSASDALTRSHEVAARARAESAAASTRASHAGGGFDHVTGALHTDAGRLESAHEAWNSTRGGTLSAARRDTMLHEAIGDVVDTCGGVKKFVHTYGLHNGRELSARCVFIYRYILNEFC